MKFSRKHRLITKAEYRRVFSEPVVTRDRYFRVFRRENGLAFSRLGLAVSRRVCRNATGRNRLKRLIRESFRQFRENREEARGFDFVVLPTEYAATICNRTLLESLEHHWIRARESKSGPKKTDSGNDR